MSRFCSTGAHLPPRHARAHFYHIAVQSAQDTGRARERQFDLKKKQKIRNTSKGCFYYISPDAKAPGGSAFPWAL